MLTQFAGQLTPVDMKSYPSMSMCAGMLASTCALQLTTVDIKCHQSMSMCAGMLASTCAVQLWAAGVVLSAIFVPIGHPGFWAFVRANVAWPLSIVAIIAWHALSQVLLQKYVTPGTSIKRPFAWLFLYMVLSTAYCVVRPLATSFVVGLRGFSSTWSSPLTTASCVPWPHSVLGFGRDQ